MQPWIQTYTGKKFLILNPRPEDICIEDIAHSLSMQCRFNGHTKQFYSVAQHSVLVSRHVPPEFALHGLLHDAAEAYMGDIIAPVKHSTGDLEHLESSLMMAIAERFDIYSPQGRCDKPIQEADRRMLATEARDLLIEIVENWTDPYEPYPETIWPVWPHYAEQEFLLRFAELLE